MERSLPDPCDAGRARGLATQRLEDRAIAKPERLTMTRPDELVVEGWLLDPPGRDPLTPMACPWWWKSMVDLRPCGA